MTSLRARVAGEAPGGVEVSPRSARRATEISRVCGIAARRRLSSLSAGAAARRRAPESPPRNAPAATRGRRTGRRPSNRVSGWARAWLTPGSADSRGRRPRRGCVSMGRRRRTSARIRGCEMPTASGKRAGRGGGGARARAGAAAAAGSVFIDGIQLLHMESILRFEMG